jgi:hypothetical protein
VRNGLAFGIEFEDALVEALREPEPLAVVREERSRVVGARVARFAQFKAVTRNVAADAAVIVIAVLADDEAQFVADAGRADGLSRATGNCSKTRPCFGSIP